jgi:hypothetical protein
MRQCKLPPGRRMEMTELCLMATLRTLFAPA